jgi:hypothetical protein
VISGFTSGAMSVGLANDDNGAKLVAQVVPTRSQKLAEHKPQVLRRSWF